MSKKRSPNPKHHILKLHPNYWDLVMNGKKRSEIRKLDRDYQVGDTISFRKFPKTSVWNRTSDQFKITYILKADDFPVGLQPGYGLICIKPKNP